MWNRRFFIGTILGIILAALFLLWSAAHDEKNRLLSQAVPGMVLIREGAFIMGSDKVDVEDQAAEFGSSRPWYLDEHPERRIFLEPFFIDKHEVSNAQYKKFIEAANYDPPSHWINRNYPPGQADHPVSRVNWFDAMHYCRWAGKRLPTEAEWEKAARGTDGREYPYGETYDETKANIVGVGETGTAPVGFFAEGKSPYGVYDMAGNVAEWTSDWYQAYPGSTHVSPFFGEEFKVIRGGGWARAHFSIKIFSRAAHRFYAAPHETFTNVGFRCAKSLS